MGMSKGKKNSEISKLNLFMNTSSLLALIIIKSDFLKGFRLNPPILF